MSSLRLNLFILSLAFSMISNEVFSKNLKTGNLSVRIESLDHFDKDQKKAWPSICKKFSQKFVIGKGFWSSGIAKKAGCELTRDQIKHLNSIEGMKTPKNDSRITSKPSYELKIKIEGEIPERKDEDENIAEKFIGKAVGFWDGFKRQLFSTKNPDERKIIFELNYLHNKKPIYMAKRIYNYSDKFLGYFDLDGFIDLLAFDILIESPYQWDISILKKREFLDGLDKKKMFSFEKIDNAVNLERNLNLYFVRPVISSSSIYVAESFPNSIDTKSSMNLELSKDNLLKEYIVFNTLSEIPSNKGIFLSVGSEPYSHFYTHKKFEYLLRKLDKLDLTFYFADSTFGISQLLLTNDELSFAGFRYAKGLADDKKLLDSYYNFDLKLNKGFLKGLIFNLDVFPKSEEKQENVDLALSAYRARIGYKYSLLLPFVGAIDLVPNIGIWNYDLTISNEFNSDSFSQSASPSVGIGVGYSINIFDFVTSALYNYSIGISDESNITNSSLRFDVGYKIRNIYKLRSFDPAIYGFVANQDISVTNKDVTSAVDGFSIKGLVVGVGGVIIWE